MGSNKSGRPRGKPLAYRSPGPRVHPLIVILRKLRIKKGLTQGDLAEKAGYSIRTIESIERGKNTPEFHTLQILALALGVKMALVDADGQEITDVEFRD